MASLSLYFLQCMIMTVIVSVLYLHNDVKEELEFLAASVLDVL